MINISEKHNEFIKIVAQGLPQNVAYRTTIGNPSTTAKTSKEQGSKLAKKYAKEIQQSRLHAAALIKAASDSISAKEALKQIVNQAEADAKVFRILSTDNDIVEDVIIISGKAQIVKRKPNQGEIQKAYDLYCKRFGSNAPTKIANTDKEGNDASPSINIIQYISKELLILENE